MLGLIFIVEKANKDVQRTDRLAGPGRDGVDAAAPVHLAGAGGGGREEDRQRRQSLAGRQSGS